MYRKLPGDIRKKKFCERKYFFSWNHICNIKLYIHRNFYSNLISRSGNKWKKTKKPRIYTYKKIPDFWVFFGHNFWTDWARKKVKTVLESTRSNESFDIHNVYWFENFFRGHWLGRVATRCFRIVQVSHYRKKMSLYIFL